MMSARGMYDDCTVCKCMSCSTNSYDVDIKARCRPCIDCDGIPQPNMTIEQAMDNCLFGVREGWKCPNNIECSKDDLVGNVYGED